MSWAKRHPVIAGAVIGICWGSLMRAWMRYVSTSPEFSWSGTLFIIGAAATVGSILGFARHRRIVGGVGWWRLSALSLVLLGAGGAVMWPSVVAGGAAFAIRRPRWMRWPLAGGAAVAQIPVLLETVVDNWTFGATDKVIAILWYLPMLALEAWAFSVVFASRMEDAPMPGRVKRIALAAPVAMAALLGGVAMGIPGG